VTAETPFTILDSYAPSTGAWVRIEHPDGRRETLTPDDALELVCAARIVAANATQPGAAARMEARHLTLALGEAFVELGLVNPATISHEFHDERPEFPDGEFGKPFVDPQPEPRERSDAEIDQLMSVYYERQDFDTVGEAGGE
jgi:hypothetical protein